MKQQPIASYGGGIDSDASVDNSVNMQRIPKVFIMPNRRGMGQPVLGSPDAGMVKGSTRAKKGSMP